MSHELDAHIATKRLLFVAARFGPLGLLFGCGLLGPATEVIDSRDGEVYPIVRVGEQAWLGSDARWTGDGPVCPGQKDLCGVGGLAFWGNIRLGPHDERKGDLLHEQRRLERRGSLLRVVGQ